MGEEKTNLSDHFHNFLFKKMFLQRKKGYLFSGCENDERGYSDVNNFTKLLLRKSNRNISSSGGVSDIGKSTINFSGNSTYTGSLPYQTLPRYANCKQNSVKQTNL